MREYYHDFLNNISQHEKVQWTLIAFLKSSRAAEIPGLVELDLSLYFVYYSLSAGLSKMSSGDTLRKPVSPEHGLI